MVVWDGFEVFAPRGLAYANRIGGRQARALFRLRMELLDTRNQELKDFAFRNGFVLNGSKESLESFGGWLVDVIEPDYERLPMPTWPWMPLAYDLGLYMASLAISRHEMLHWDFVSSGKRNISYHQPVISGFRSLNRISIDSSFSSTFLYIVNCKAPAPDEVVVVRGREVVVGGGAGAQKKSTWLADWLYKTVAGAVDRDVALRDACDVVEEVGIDGVLDRLREMAHLPMEQREAWAFDKNVQKLIRDWEAARDALAAGDWKGARKAMYYSSVVLTDGPGGADREAPVAMLFRALDLLIREKAL